MDFTDAVIAVTALAAPCVGRSVGRRACYHNNWRLFNARTDQLQTGHLVSASDLPERNVGPKLPYSPTDKRIRKGVVQVNAVEGMSHHHEWQIPR